MSKPSKTQPAARDPRLQTALNLDGSAQAIKQFYAQWADTYDQETAAWNYAAPVHAVNLLTELKHNATVPLDPDDPTLKIMDAGCGTGLLAGLLTQLGYRNIDGFDLSEEMVAIARKTGWYGQLCGNVDLNQPLPSHWQNAYDCTICVGVFTPGHVPPESLTRLIDLTRPGGVIIVSTRVTYYASENYQAIVDQLQAAGRITLLASLKNATYTNDEQAHYWVYQKTEDRD